MKIKIRDAAAYITRQAGFDAGSLRGMTRGGMISAEAIGHLPETWADRLVSTYAAGRLAYVVFSYVTPIAWVDIEGGITIPPVRYSLTTTQHQYLVADALAVSGWNAYGDDAQTKFTEVRADSDGRSGGW